MTRFFNFNSKSASWQYMWVYIFDKCSNITTSIFVKFVFLLLLKMKSSKKLRVFHYSRQNKRKKWRIVPWLKKNTLEKRETEKRKVKSDRWMRRRIEEGVVALWARAQSVLAAAATFCWFFFSKFLLIFSKRVCRHLKILNYIVNIFDW